ncbi:cupin domain-containing protein [Amnibacterium endophyticum]|uniref:Cupin domain-containing protein n=1 Tax=Amnibacterium endophyticum TaxID=2109337 RepID=A0ABW4LGN5_9MICO
MATAVRYSVEGDVLEELEVPPRAAALGLAPHPEGGWYRRTWASSAAVPTDAGERAAATLILFLLPPGEASAWHRVASDEVWLWHGPDPVVLQLGGDGDAPEEGERRTLDATAPQALVPGGVWQRTLPAAGEALVSCVVSPGFDFADFALAEP